MFKRLSQPSPTYYAPALQQERQAREAYAEQCALVVFSAYNRADFNDPELFVANTVTMLGQYPEAVIAEVCNPHTGIQARSKWPPKVSELRDECERVAAEHASRERRALLHSH